MASHGNDVWLEVWHLAFDGRTRPRHKPRGWADFLDHGQAGWWYILAPGSGIFYHAGRTLAAPSKAAMLATLLEEWAQSGMQESDSSGHKGVRGGGKGGGRRLSGSHHFSGGQQKAAREMIGKFTMNDPLAFAGAERRHARGTSLASFGRRVSKPSSRQRTRGSIGPESLRQIQHGTGTQTSDRFPLSWPPVVSLPPPPLQRRCYAWTLFRSCSWPLRAALRQQRRTVIQMTPRPCATRSNAESDSETHRAPQALALTIGKRCKIKSRPQSRRPRPRALCSVSR